MAETYRLTRVEELNRDFPGLEDLVRQEMQKGTNLAEISAKVASKFPSAQVLAISTLHSYWQRRFAPDLEQQRRAFQNAKARADLLMELEHSGNLDAQRIVALLVREKILENSEALAGADPVDLVKLDLRRAEGEGRMEIERSKLGQAEKELQLKREALAVENRRLELEIEKFRSTLDKVKEIAQDVISGEGKAFDPVEAMKKISAVIGVGGAVEERIEN
ncbi:MAG TPA: hypothetical protein VGZ29_05690 [Terriglobia bacterium]|nr:hypothetical protein [Terriglobia bacterium]